MKETSRYCTGLVGNVGDRQMVGLDDPSDLFQLWCFYDSMNAVATKKNIMLVLLIVILHIYTYDQY